VVALGIALLLGLVGCTSSPPDPASETYRTAVSAFYTGVAAVQVGENQRAQEKLRRVTELVPGEPAAWANRGVLALRQRRLDDAATYLEEARRRAPESSQIRLLSGLLERERGNLDRAAGHLAAAVEQDSQNVKAAYVLSRVLEQRSADGDAARARRLVAHVRTVRPANLVARLEGARLAAKQGSADSLRRAVDALSDQADEWPAPARAQLDSLRRAVEAEDLRGAATQIAFLKNTLKRVRAYQRSQAALQPTDGGSGELIARLLWMPEPDPELAPADTGLTFAAEPLSRSGVGSSGGSDGSSDAWPWVRPYTLTDQGPPRLVAADGEAVQVDLGFEKKRRLDFPGGAEARPPSPFGVAGIDYDYDFRMDFALAGPGGLRLYRRRSSDTFTDVTGEALPDAAAQAAYWGVWAADVDMEGDLDLVAAPEAGAPVVLRNNGDDTFTAQSLFGGVGTVRGFEWADLDADGDPDAALLGADGTLRLLANQRRQTPRFTAMEASGRLSDVRAIDVADVNSDGRLDLVALRAGGAVVRLSPATGERETLLHWDGAGGEAPAGGASDVAAARLFLSDVDNNGGLDVVASVPGATRVWLQRAGGTYVRLGAGLDVQAVAVADLEDRGRLDLLGAGEQGPVRLANQGEKQYQSARFRPQAARATGDRRINPYGIGGEIELRAGLLFQKQPISDRTVHFGLGEHTTADVARIVWPNGTVQAEFDLQSTQTILTRQRLKGSCPWVYTYDGTEMTFVKDFLWRTALGLRINAQGPAQVMHSVDWIKIPGDRLAARDGAYDVRITGELWETHFFDEVDLLAVDHPPGTRVWADEALVLPAPEQELHVTGPLQPFAGVQDTDGRNVARAVRARDGTYLDTFALRGHQGTAEEHHVELALGPDAPPADSLVLVASGWTYPTDTSINVALSQGDHAPPRGLRLEVPDGEGGWTVVRDNLGFPAGKKKTMLVSLDGLFEGRAADAPRRFRLRTNMEIYWDRLAWARDRSAAPVDTHRVEPSTARLRYRGFSATRKPERSVPETPDYQTIAATTQEWRDLVGYYTRFGDVRELIMNTDDRYVIMNAGDEMRLRFPVPPARRPDWTRDFILVGDGWVKDGDYNTGFSRTVRPLPYHGMEDYTTPPVPLEEDPAYRRHPEDWHTYHTRYVTPRRFQQSLAFQPSP
jgi:hypothetical protein